MSVDLTQSRRGYNSCCSFWHRRENEGSKQIPSHELVHNRVADGVFWAREMSGETSRNNIIGGNFMFDSAFVSIKSPDDLSILKSEDIVLYEGEYWIVKNVQKKQARTQQAEYARNMYCSHYWYIDLRK